MRSNFGNRGKSNRPARPLDWVCAQMDVVLGNSIGAAWLIDPIFTLETFTDPTLMATRAFVSMRQLGEQTVGTGFASIGIIAWDGTSSLAPLDPPGPLSDCDFDWINRWVGIVHVGSLTGTLLNPNVFDNTHLSKARRRLPSGTGLLVCFEGEGVIQALDFGIDIRCLIKE